MVLVVLVLSLVAVPSQATNGMNMIGYGAVSSGMGGADLAVVDNAAAMNINPAGICSCEGPQLIIGTSILRPKLLHTQATQRSSAEDNNFFLPLIAYVAPLGQRGLTLGLGAFAQGGMGVDYSQLATPFMTTDELYSNLSYLRINPTLAWQTPNERLKLGVGINMGQANVEIRNFPDTFVAGLFDGFRVDHLKAIGYNIRVGFQYHWRKLSIGGSWISRTDLKFRDGDMVFASAPNTVESASLKGFNWPQQVGLGFAYSLSPAFRIAADIDWIEWSEAVDQPVLHGKDRALLFDLGWQDQWVYALGIEWLFLPNWTLRVGYNHGTSPVPEEKVATLFPAIIEDHATLGLGYSTARWKLDLAYEQGLENNLNQPSTATAEKHDQETWHAMITWFF